MSAIRKVSTGLWVEFDDGIIWNRTKHHDCIFMTNGDYLTNAVFNEKRTNFMRNGYPVSEFSYDIALSFGASRNIPYLDQLALPVP